MFSLFISFDMLISYVNQTGYWFFFIFFFIFYSVNYLFSAFIMSFLKLFLVKEISTASKVKSNMNGVIFFSVFSLIFILNFGGMWPYFFTFSSQLNFCFMISAVLWISIMFNNSFNKLYFFVPHLVPLGSPLILSQFMVFIETVSQLIRPLTLGVRLMANMTAGHLIMILTSGSFFFLSAMTMPLLLLLLLEFAVALIQAYVFTILVSMYAGEFND